MITVLCGGVGAARLLAGLVDIVDPTEVTAVVNVGDDTILHGLAVSPDLDTITYTVSGSIDPGRGWGLAGETWHAKDALTRFQAVRPAGSEAGSTWFGLGDRDLATHLYRTQRLREGATLTQATAEIAKAWGLAMHLLPVTDDRVPTMVTIVEADRPPAEVSFQDYFVRLGHSVPVRSVRFDGADRATPTAQVLAAIESADRIIIAPSNPIVSIGPLVAIPAVRAALERRRADVVAVSPIVAGAALKGPADRMLTELGHQASVVGVAALYRSFAARLVVDVADRDRAAEIEAAGMRCVAIDTIMRDRAAAGALCRALLELSTEEQR